MAMITADQAQAAYPSARAIIIGLLAAGRSARAR